MILDLCRCGCGEPAPLAQRTNHRKGHRKGHPLRFVSGHNSRLSEQIRRLVAGGPDECWTWRGAHDRKGYGRVQVRGRHTGAHRFVYERLVGHIPPDMDLDHLCRNTGCVNPGHLEPVTPAENRRRQSVRQRMIAVTS